jgi:hypothetical protein
MRVRINHSHSCFSESLRLAEATDGRAYNLLPAACCVLLAFPR